jgi:hypothetical protein
MGIRGSLSRNYSISTDGEALLKAMQPGVSGAFRGVYGSSDNAGAGLFITRRFAEASDGYFALMSGSAGFRTSLAEKRPDDDRLLLPILRFPGTLVSVEIGLDWDIDFGDALGVAREAFGTRLQSRSDEVERRVQFE